MAGFSFDVFVANTDERVAFDWTGLRVDMRRENRVPFCPELFLEVPPGTEAGAKAPVYFGSLVARLKPCPCYKAVQADCFRVFTTGPLSQNRLADCQVVSKSVPCYRLVRVIALL